MIINGIAGIVIFFVIPLFLGRGLSFFLKLSPLSCVGRLCRDCVSGHLLMWMLFQVIAVPCILLRLPFMTVWLCWGLVLLLILGAFFWKGWLSIDVDSEKRELRTFWKGWMRAACLLVLVLIAFQCSKYIFFAHVDFDDSRFITNAVEAYDKNTMLRLHPITGERVDYLVGDRAKDVSSPWSIYLATMGRLTGMHPATIAHTVYAPVLLLISYFVYFVIGELLMASERKAVFFVLAIAGLNLFYAGSAQLQSVFSLTRIWQGKAVFGAIGIPAHFMVYLMLMQVEEGNRALWCYLLMLSLACCLFSGFGIIGAGILSGGLGLWYIFAKRRWKELPCAMVTLLPSLVYGGLYLLLK